MELNAQTVLADVIAEYPFMRLGMASINRKFAMLQTPIGKIMMRKATLADVAARSGMPTGELLAAIAEKTGATVAVSPAPAQLQAEAPAPDANDLPAWFSQAESFEVFDARKAEGFFLPELEKRADAVQVGEGIEVVQSFEPIPLYDVLGEKGFEHVTRQVASDEFRVSFYRTR